MGSLKISRGTKPHKITLPVARDIVERQRRLEKEREAPHAPTTTTTDATNAGSAEHNQKGDGGRRLARRDTRANT